MEHPGRGDWDSELQDDLSGKGRTAELSSVRMPGQSGDEDGNVSALRATVCPRHHGDSGGRKLPPPTVHLMRHAGSQEGLERTAPGHSTLCMGFGAEETTACRGGGEVEFRAGLRGLRGSYKECVGISIPGEVVDGGRR